MIAERGGRLSMALSARFPILPRRAMTVAMTAIDMPIGLSDDGPRGCDSQARKLLSPRGSCVFPVPPRGTLKFGDYAAANGWAKQATGKGISKQSWNIMPRIRELDALISPADQTHMREAHPELAFLRLNEMVPLPPKATADGQRLRIALLTQAGFDLAPFLSVLPRKWVKADDILDAAVLSLTARRCAEGTAVCLGERTDATGKRMEIWY